MRRWAPVAVLLAAFSVLSLTLVGCSSKEDDLGKRRSRNRDDREDNNTTTDGNQTTEMKEIKGTGEGTLRGTVKVADGKMPDIEALNKKLLDDIKASKDSSTCMMAPEEDRSEYTWVVDKASGGVKNVFVWLRPVDEKKEFFNVKDLAEKVKGFDKVKSIDQPYCAFEPHAMVIFPRYVDPAKPSANYRLTPDKGGPPATPQEFKVVNTGTLSHNTNTISDQSGRMKGINEAVPPNGKVTINDIQPSYKAPVEVKCSIHSWMKSWVWAFDHPFAAVTNKKGEFVIENAPAGVKLRVVVWHEQAKFLDGGEKGTEIELKAGENTKNFTISPRE